MIVAPFYDLQNPTIHERAKEEKATDKESSSEEDSERLICQEITRRLHEYIFNQFFSISPVRPNQLQSGEAAFRPLIPLIFFLRRNREFLRFELI